MEVDPDTQDFLRRLWAGLLNSKLVEDGNKVQREAEQRNGSNKTLGRVEGWHGLSRQKLLKSYERPEVPTMGMAELPGSFLQRTGSCGKSGQASSSSRPTRASEEEDILVGVSSARTWASHTPESQQDNLASFSLLAKVVREKRDWSFVEKGWWASLLLEGCPPCYVVRTYRRAATAARGSSCKQTWPRCAGCTPSTTTWSSWTSRPRRPFVPSQLLSIFLV